MRDQAVLNARRALLRPFDDRTASRSVGRDRDPDGGLFSADAGVALAPDGDDDVAHAVSLRDAAHRLRVGIIARFEPL